MAANRPVFCFLAPRRRNGARPLSAARRTDPLRIPQAFAALERRAQRLLAALRHRREQGLAMLDKAALRLEAIRVLVAG